MPDSPLTAPCVLFAMSHEARGLQRALPRWRAQAGGPCPVWLAGHEHPAVVVLAGVGAAAVTRALRWVLGAPRLGPAAYRPRLVLSAGFSGGLRAGLRPGELVLATEVAEEGGARWQVPWRPAGGVGGGFPLRAGRVLAVDRVISDPAGKRRLGEAHDALAVDMESAAAARLCAEKEVPFGCLRVVLDDVQSPLAPELARLIEGGRVRPLALVKALLRRPSLVGHLARLARGSREAADRLGQVLAGALARDPRPAAAAAGP